uniref:Uncharacterized protein n=1 Tax=Sinocyclocheilus rhinocerous TaxID=307959 RepID=A0A673HP55_9TELE
MLSMSAKASRSKSMVMGEASRGSPSLQEGVLKAGWLKKQRSIMKNWQLPRASITKRASCSESMRFCKKNISLYIYII